MQAQKILARVKRRDLYNCVVKIPVSKSVNRCDTHGLPKDIVRCKECHNDDTRLEVVKTLLKNDQQLKLFTEEICKDLPQIKPEQDIWVEVSIIIIDNKTPPPPNKINANTYTG